VISIIEAVDDPALRLNNIRFLCGMQFALASEYSESMHKLSTSLSQFQNESTLNEDALSLCLLLQHSKQIGFNKQLSSIISRVSESTAGVIQVFHFYCHPLISENTRFSQFQTTNLPTATDEPKIHKIN
jgi:short subunit fatty acids transporter